jgi:hypothetical protein
VFAISAKGCFSDNGYNLSDDSSCRLSGIGSRNDVRIADLDLGLLATNGGPTQTIALLSAKSLAVDQIPTKPTNFCTDANGNPLTTDQRGEPRPDPMDGPTASATSALTSSRASHRSIAARPQRAVPS